MTRFLALFVSTIGLAASAMADTAPVKPVMVELFASQNCPSCPKAHKTMREMQDTRADVMVLTWSVDYWDYLGDPDPMAIPQAKARQAAYAEWLGLRAPYTPQSIYNGVKECPGPRRKQVKRNIDALSRSLEPTDPVITDTDGTLTITAASDTVFDIVQVEYLTDDQHETGMVNPVTMMDVIGQWPAHSEAITPACQNTCVIMLQSPETGEVSAVWQSALP